jgi:hypothetical protein
LLKSVFDGLQAQLIANRLEFYHAFPENRSTDSTALARKRGCDHRQLVAAGHGRASA